ncbi:Hypothetical predicted protein [Paramuricea clavata]|uniref:Uncharacterized protein n=1 Tax=Paramuricea clavata TaxID=317549 RepID=A0A7D9ELP6_PARCT|nr:Hypothetical predicted protein [Paramuricea clavata]
MASSPNLKVTLYKHGFATVEEEDKDVGVWVDNCEKFNYPHYCDKERLLQMKKVAEKRRKDTKKEDECAGVKKEDKSADSSEMVDVTQKLVFDDVFYETANIVAYNIKYSNEEFADTNYVTVIQRFYSPVSCLQVWDDWICKNYPTKRWGIDIFSIWHPSRSEIGKRAIKDDVVDDTSFRRDTLWRSEQGEYCEY